MQKLSNVELHFVTTELQPLVKSRLIKVYAIGEREYRFKFKKDGSEYSLQVNLPQGLYLSKFAKDSFEDDFVKALRKRIANWIVDRVYQLNSDKVIIIELGRNRLYFDFIGKGNIILENEGIIDLVETKDERRSLLKGQKYSMPENTKVSFLELDKATSLSELNLPKKMQESLPPENWKFVLEKFLEKPVISVVQDEVKLAFQGTSQFNSISEALDEINKPEVVVKRSPAFVKLTKRLEDQKLALKKGLENIVRMKEKADFINANRWLIQEKIKNKEYKENDKEIILELD